MGRRAKNKQGDPKPLQEDASNKPSQKKLGKRKADSSDRKDSVSKRPAKKVKQDDASPAKSILKKKSKNDISSKKHKSNGVSFVKTKRKLGQKPEGEDESDDGWEGVESTNDASAAKKCVFLYAYSLLNLEYHSI